MRSCGFSPLLAQLRREQFFVRRAFVLLGRVGDHSEQERDTLDQFGEALQHQQEKA